MAWHHRWLCRIGFHDFTKWVETRRTPLYDSYDFLKRNPVGHRHHYKRECTRCGDVKFGHQDDID